MDHRRSGRQCLAACGQAAARRARSAATREEWKRREEERRAALTEEERAWLDLRAEGRQWLLLPDADSLMHLAIFMDAHAVAGDASLLAAVRERLAGLVPADAAADLAAMVLRVAGGE